MKQFKYLGASAALVAGLGLTTAAVAEETVVIGFAGGLTGYLAFYDGMVKNGAQMAVDEINAKGGIAGKYKIDFRVKDMRSETPAAAIATQDLLDEGMQFMLVPCDVDPAIAAGQLAQAAEVPMMAPCASTPTLPAQVGDYMFNLKTADNLQAAVLAQYARDQGYTNAYVLLSPDTPYTEALPRYFIEVFEKKGGNVAAIGTYSFDQQDFSAEVTAIRALTPPPDVIMTSAYEPQFPAFITQLRNAGITTPVLGSDGIDSPTTLGLGAVAEGVVFSMGGFPIPDGSLDKFYKAYAERYGEDLPYAFSATGYEAIHLFAKAIEEAGTLEGSAVRDALDGIEDFPGVTGTTITYKDQNRVALRDVTLVKVEDSQQTFVLQEAPAPADVPAP